MTTMTSDILEKLIPKMEARIKRNMKIHKFISLEDDIMIDIPNRSTDEHRKIAEYSKAPWAAKIINSRVRRLMVSGIRDKSGSSETAWGIWKTWKMTSKQKTAYREAVTYGDAYMELRKTIGNKTMTFNKSPLMSSAFYGFDDFSDAYNSDYPTFFIEKNLKGDKFKVWDSTTVSIWEPTVNHGYRLLSVELHGFEVVPIIRYINDIDSMGKSVGAIEPLIPTILRIMKATYDSGMVNHNNSWHVRYATGLSAVTDVEPFEGETPEEFNSRVARMEEGMRLEIGTSDILTSTDKDTKFGSLPATPPNSFVEVIESMLKELASLSDTPSDYITGDVVSQSAEQSANSQANYLALISELRAIFGESNEQLLRLHAVGTGISEDYFTSITWEEMDKGVLAAQVDALGKSAAMLKIPEMVLWEEYPNMTPEKLEVWKEAARVRDEKEQSALFGLMKMGNEGAIPGEIARDLELEE